MLPRGACGVLSKQGAGKGRLGSLTISQPHTVQWLTNRPMSQWLALRSAMCLPRRVWKTTNSLHDLDLPSRRQWAHSSSLRARSRPVANDCHICRSWSNKDTEYRASLPCSDRCADDHGEAAHRCSGTPSLRSGFRARRYHSRIAGVPPEEPSEGELLEQRGREDERRPRCPIGREHALARAAWSGSTWARSAAAGTRRPERLAEYGAPGECAQRRSCQNNGSFRHR